MLCIIANTVQCKLPGFTYNFVRYGNQRPDHHAIQISGNETDNRWLPFRGTVVILENDSVSLSCLGQRRERV